MTDDQQRARELLAQEYERDGITHVPDCIRREAMLTTMEDRAIRAITAALRAAPDAVALRTAMETLEQIASAPDDQGAKLNAAATVAFLETQGAGGPEGFVVVPEVMDIDMEVAFCEAWFSKRRCIDDPEMQDAWAAALAARPQGVKDV